MTYVRMIKCMPYTPLEVVFENFIEYPNNSTGQYIYQFTGALDNLYDKESILISDIYSCGLP